MNLIQMNFNKKSIFLSFIILYIVILLFASCKKTNEFSKKQLFLKAANLDTLGLYTDRSLTELIPLADHTILLHYRNWFFPPNYIDRFEHYDENFNLLNSITYNNLRFGKIIVNGNNDIVTSTAYFIQNKLYYQFLKFDNHMKIIQVNNDPQIKSGLQPLVNMSFENKMVRLSNGQYVLSFYTNDGYGGDSARIVSAAYNNPFTDVTPIWIDRNKYFDFNQNIKNSYVVDLGADQQNNFYILSKNASKDFIIRKHKNDGSLVWQKLLKNSYALSEREAKLFVEDDRLIVSTPSNVLYVIDFNGNVTQKKLSYPINPYINKLSNHGGYVAMSDSNYTIGKFATLLKFTHDFDLVKSKQYGSMGTSTSFVTQLTNNKLMVTAFVESPELTGLNLMMFKVNDELEIID